MSDILFLAHRVPFPPDRGDKIRAHHLLRFLARDARVHVGCFWETQADRDALSDLARQAVSYCAPQRRKALPVAGAQAVLSGKPVSLTAFYSAKLAHWVNEVIATNPISAIVVFSGQMGQYIPEDFAGRVIVDLCDVDSAKFETYADAGDRPWVNAREARLLALEEERLAQRADATILISRAEAELFEGRLAQPERANVCVIGNGIDAREFDPARIELHAGLAGEAGPHFVFTGQMDYRPNEQAAHWAIDEFLPAIRAAFPEAKVHIVGRAPRADLLEKSKRDGVKVWGEVPDVKPFLAAADCVIAPLQIARGVQNKVLEAMAMARPVLLTQEAATGINTHDGGEWMISPADPATMAARARAILEDKIEAERMGNAARTFVLAHHDWHACLAPLGELLSGETKPEARDAA